MPVTTLVDKAAAQPPAGSKPAQIIAAAKELFTSQGFGATSMDAIARTANVSKATLYAHFSGKEELFAAMVSGECRTQSRMLCAPDLDDHTLPEALAEIGRNFLGLLLSRQAIAVFRIVVAESTRFPELGRIFFDSGPNQMRESLADYLQKAAGRGQLVIEDSYRAAEHLIGMLQTPVHMRVLFGIKDHFTQGEVEQVVADAISAFLRAYLPRQQG